MLISRNARWLAMLDAEGGAEVLANSNADKGNRQNTVQRKTFGQNMCLWMEMF